GVIAAVPTPKLSASIAGPLLLQIRIGELPQVEVAFSTRLDVAVQKEDVGGGPVQVPEINAPYLFRVLVCPSRISFTAHRVPGNAAIEVSRIPEILTQRILHI